MQNITSVKVNFTRHAIIAPRSLSENDIISAAMEARVNIARGEVAASDAVRDWLNSEIIVPTNAAILGEQLYGIGAPTGPMMNPVRRKAGNRKNSVKRGFTFAVQGLEGVFKLNPFRKIGDVAK